MKIGPENIGDTESASFETLACQIGPSAALKLSAFYSQASGSLYVPGRYIPGHRIEKLIGEQSFRWLIENYGGETIFPVGMAVADRAKTMGKVVYLLNHGVPANVIRKMIGYHPSYTARIIKWCRDNGIVDDADTGMSGTKRRACFVAMEEMVRRLMTKVLAGDFPITDPDKKRACSALAKAGALLDEHRDKKGIVAAGQAMLVVSELLAEAEAALGSKEAIQ